MKKTFSFYKRKHGSIAKQKHIETKHVKQNKRIITITFSFIVKTKASIHVAKQKHIETKNEKIK